MSGVVFRPAGGGEICRPKISRGVAGAVGCKVAVLQHRGVNLAPWNWAGAEIAGEPFEAGAAGGRVRVGDDALVVFHFARFRPVRSDRWWQAGQLDYGVMPRCLRNAIYGPYVRALLAARDEIAARRAGFDFPCFFSRPCEI